MMLIRTSRLLLIPMTPDFLRASLSEDLAQAERLIGLKLPQGWPDIPDILELRLRQLELEPTLQPWLLRAIGLQSNREMVGHIGFHTAPGADYLQPWCPQGVEFGFAVSPAHRRRGYAREASVALMNWAHDFHDVTQFLVTISPGNEPSSKLASSLGFVRVGAHLDDTDGPEDVFVLSRRRAD